MCGPALLKLLTSVSADALFRFAQLTQRRAFHTMDLATAPHFSPEWRSLFRLGDLLDHARRGAEHDRAFGDASRDHGARSHNRFAAELDARK